MQLFATPSFFVCTLVAVLISASAHALDAKRLLGEKHVSPLITMFLSCFFLSASFFQHLDQAAYLLLYLLLACAGFLILKQDSTSKARYRIALAMSLAPLVIYKVSVSAQMSLFGFLGISYITFKALQVVIEMHGGLIKAYSLFDFFNFLIFFPTFSSGPIDRSRRFQEDMDRRISWGAYESLLSRGIMLILVGMVYKLVIAALIKRVYTPNVPMAELSLSALWTQIVIAYEYAGYLFFDFAGYSLMAIGVSNCLGVETPLNFRAPFKSLNIQDFWQRWHITLSFWLRDFCFMRITRAAIKHKLFKKRLHTAQFAFMANMLVMGFWHGITVDYIAYGIYHGVLLAISEAFHKTRWYRAHHLAWQFKIISWFITLQLVILGFALFSGQISFVVGGMIHG